MAKAPNIRRLLVEDFPEQSEWIDKLLQPVNQLSVTLSTVLNRGLSLKDNVGLGMLEVTLDTSVPTAFPLVMRHGLSSGVFGLQLVYVADTGNNPPTLPAVTALWEDLGDGRVQINNIPGLVAGRTYNLRFLAFPR